ncbi:uncharacterized protein LOC128559874 isoform X2 [Mercenaria mercenaria]|uniref:uncharacterized protein LOC128559874 isoform X2 n=1 Tax=Mercenaria mercenaria TaxID=6596 RepID=UPI00234EF9E7|nr:uncharacterized protein LOC128559874 isoform X2 [Mercenaria mercenaria]
MDISTRRNKDNLRLEDAFTDTDEITTQGILTHLVVTEDHNDCQISSSKIEMDNNTDSCSKINSDVANPLDTDQLEVRPFIVTQNEDIIDEQTQQALAISSQMTGTNVHEEISDDINVNIPDEDHTLDSEELSVTDPISIHPLSAITVALQDIANETHHVTRIHEEQNQTTEYVNKNYFDPPPDYEECIIMEYYSNNGLVCRGCQTTPNACFCSCHGEVARGNTLTDMKIKCLTWCLILSLVVAGIVFGIVAAVIYG